jgi:hypothetical protein
MRKTTILQFIKNSIHCEGWMVISFCLLLLASPETLLAQSKTSCGFDSVVKSMMRLDPDFLSKVKTMNTEINNYINTSHGGHSPSLLSPNEYYIPVVVHIVTDTNDPVYRARGPMTYKQIQSQIDALNANYLDGLPAYNGDTNIGPGDTNTHIHYCLAQIPMGVKNWTNNAEPGVMRYNGANGDRIANAAHDNNLTPASSDSLLAITGQLTNPTVFSPGNYLNIYVVNDIGGACSGIMGYSAIPIYPASRLHGWQINGPVIRADVFGDNSTGDTWVEQPNSYYGCPAIVALNEGKVLVHEVGHTFFLWHTFQYDLYTGDTCVGGGGACDTTGDFCCDTKTCTNYQGTYICGSGPLISTCNHSDTVQTWDYMFYAEDACWNTFTPDQAKRMVAYLHTYNPTLISASNWVATGILGIKGCLPPTLLADFTFTPSVACLDSTITFKAIPPPSNTATSYSWKFGDAGTGTGDSVTHKYLAAGSYTVKLTVVDGIGDTLSTTQVVSITSCSLDSNYIHKAQWFYGQYCSIDFSKGFPKPSDTAFGKGSSLDTTIFASEGAYSYADKTGNAVFYTDGINLWVPAISPKVPINTSPIFPTTDAELNTFKHKNQKTTANYGLTGVPFPGHPNMYYLFRAATGGATPGTVKYVIVDLNADTISKSKPINAKDTLMTEGAVISPACNGVDYWIITRRYFLTAHPNAFYVYLLSSLGLSDSAIISPPTGNFSCFNEGETEIKVSPDLSRVAVAGNVDGFSSPLGIIGLYNFNSSTGVISNEKLDSVPGYQAYSGVSFSRNSKEIYGIATSLTSAIFQIDDSTGRDTILAKWPYGAHYYYLQLGPDDNIYTSVYDSNVVSEIANPNNPIKFGGGHFVQRAVVFDHRSDTMQSIFGSMPNLIDGIPNPPSSPSFTAYFNSCSKVTFTLNQCWDEYNETWNFGDASPKKHGDTVSHNYVPGTYTVICTLTIPGDTGSIKISQIITVPTLNATISGPKSVCEFASPPPTYTVTPLSGSATYTWTITPSGAGDIVFNSGSTIQVAWDSTCTAILKVVIKDDSCILTGIDTIKIYAPPVVTISPSPDSVCLGSSTTLTASGAVSYVWNDGHTTNTANPITVSPAVTTTYTVTGTDAHGCTDIKTVNVKVKPVPTITVTPTSATICRGGSVNLTASGGSSYSWSPITHLTCNTCPNPTATPTATTTYTVTGTANGCSDTATVKITVDSVIKPVVSGPLYACKDSLSTYKITNPQAGFTYSWTAIGGSPSSGSGSTAITNFYPAGGDLIFTGTNGTCSVTDTVKVQTCCNPQIAYLQTKVFANDSSSRVGNSFTRYNLDINGTFTVNKSTTITDCDVEMGPMAVINILKHDTLTIITDNFGICTHIHAGCNYMWSSIRIQPGAVLISKTVGSNPSHYKTLIEDADSAVWAINTLGGNIGKYVIDSTVFNKDLKDIVVTPYGIPPYGGTAQGCIFTCRDLSGQSCVYSIKDSIIAPFTTLIPPHTGVRTNMGMDIRGVNNISINQYGTFDNMDYGIYSQGSNITVYKDTMQYIGRTSLQAAIRFFGIFPGNSLTVGGTLATQPNTFNDCMYGIVATNFIFRNKIINNNFNRTLKKIDSTAILIQNTDLPSNTTLVQGNHIYNYMLGVFCNRNIFIKAQIVQNVISTPVCGSVMKGVYVNEVARPAGALYAINEDSISTSYGIEANQVYKTQMLANTISLIPNSHLCSKIAPEFGITLTGSNTCTISGNFISTIPRDTASTGIYVSLSGGSSVTCNNITATDTGMAYSGGPMTPFRVLFNTLNTGTNTDMVGMVLEKNVILGPQSPGRVASDNTWNGTFACSSKEYIPAILAPFSTFSVRCGGACIYNPNKNGCFRTVSTVTALIIPPNPCGGGGGGGGGGGSGVAAVEQMPLLEKIAQSKIRFNEYPDTTDKIAKMNVLSAIWNNDTLLTDSIIHNFKDSLNALSLGQLMVADTSLSDTLRTHLANTFSTVSTITPTNNIEWNLKTVEMVYLRSRLYQNDSLTPTQMAMLRAIANKCTYMDGDAVYQARAMLAGYEPLAVYADDCGHSHHDERQSDANKGDTVQNISLNIYPNPNNGNFTIEYHLNTNQTGKVTLYTAIGQEVGEYSLTLSEGKMNIRNPELTNGVYIYKLCTNDNSIKVGKVIIIK